jgi:uroporphyrinogen-III synthase
MPPGPQALVTRPYEDATALAEALTARGITPVIEPLLAIRPEPRGPGALAGALGNVQAVVFTSANGVRAFAEASLMRDLPSLTVGDATAAAARAAGFLKVASAGGDVADLARLVTAQLDPAAGPIVHPSASTVAGNLAGRLRAAGFTVRRIVLYHTDPATSLSPAVGEAWRAGAIDMAFFFSPRTAATFVKLAADQAGTGAAAAAAYALSPAVARALKPLPWRTIRTAAVPTQAALLALLDNEGRAAPNQGARR